MARYGPVEITNAFWFGDQSRFRFFIRPLALGKNWGLAVVYRRPKTEEES